MFFGMFDESPKIREGLLFQRRRCLPVKGGGGFKDLALDFSPRFLWGNDHFFLTFFFFFKYGLKPPTSW